jgi:hypothetical protein
MSRTHGDLCRENRAESENARHSPEGYIVSKYMWADALGLR